MAGWGVPGFDLAAGKPDLVTANDEADETVFVLANRGDGSFRAKHGYRAADIPTSVAIGDRRPDLERTALPLG